MGQSLEDKLEFRTADQGGQRAVLREQIKLLVALSQTEVHLPRGRSAC